MDTRGLDRLHLRTVLCLVDFSEPSRRALAASAALARDFESDVWVLHVREDVPRSGRVLPPWATAAADTHGRERLLRRLRSFVREATMGKQAVNVAVRDGDAVRETLRYARTLGADVIVAGTPASSSATAFALGRIEALSSIPLLLVPHDAAPPHAGTQWLQQVVCAVDLSPVSRGALDLALRLVLETGGALTVLHVHDPHRTPDASAGRLDGVRLDAQRLRMLVPPGVERWCDIHYLAIEGKPAHEISSVARRIGADLIVVGSEPQAASGSTGMDLLRHASTPVLVARRPSPRPLVPRPDWTSEPLGAA